MLRTEEEIKKKLEELDKRMGSMVVSDYFGIASTDGQRFILQWVLKIQ